jgi:hypothetical protein
MFIGADISGDTFSVAGLGAEGNEPFSGSVSGNQKDTRFGHGGSFMK